MIRFRMKYHPDWTGFRIAFPEAVMVQRMSGRTHAYPAGSIFVVGAYFSRDVVSLISDDKEPTTIYINRREVNRNGGFLVIDRPRKWRELEAT